MTRTEEGTQQDTNISSVGASPGWDPPDTAITGTHTLMKNARMGSRIAYDNAANTSASSITAMRVWSVTNFFSVRVAKKGM